MATDELNTDLTITTMEAAAILAGLNVLEQHINGSQSGNLPEVSKAIVSLRVKIIPLSSALGLI